VFEFRAAIEGPFRMGHITIVSGKVCVLPSNERIVIVFPVKAPVELAQSANSPLHTFKLTRDESTGGAAASCEVHPQKATKAINKHLVLSMVITSLLLKNNLI
jgi:hypothetical protein